MSQRASTSSQRPRASQSQSQRSRKSTANSSKNSSQRSRGGAASQREDLRVPRESVLDLVRAILNHSLNKYPFKRTDLTKIALNGETKLFPAAFKEAQKILADVYGFRVAETGKENQYIIVAESPPSTLDEFSPEERGRITLLFVVLAYIFMQGGQVSEAALWEFLQRLRISDDAEHPFFGNARKLITDTFVRQLYLCHDKVNVEGTDQEKILFSWGQRAELEWDRKKVLGAVCDIMQQPIYHYFNRYVDAYGQESVSRGEVPSELERLTGLGLTQTQAQTQAENRTDEDVEMADAD